ncbi:MAG: peptidase, partial [Thermoplasmata archaeon]|nr:peptidase [Thermoplasmata archaeon]
MEALITMWLQARLYILVGLMFAILYGILVGIGYYLHIIGFMFYLLIIGVAAGFVLLQYAIGPKIVEWSMRVKYVSEQEYPKL